MEEKTKIGKRIKKIRREKNISVELLAQKLGVSPSTVYRYENASIEKIPIHIFDRICEILDVAPAALLGNVPSFSAEAEGEAAKNLPPAFANAQEAMEFMLKLPTLAAFGGYDPEKMSDETIVAFANEILQQLSLVSYKYKNI